MAVNLFELALNIKSTGAAEAKTALSQVDAAGKQTAVSIAAMGSSFDKTTKLINDSRTKFEAWQATAANQQATSAHVTGVNKMTSAHELSFRGMSKLTNAFESFAGHLAGVHPLIGKVSTTLLELGAGGAVTLGVVAGVAALVLVYDQLTEGTRKAREETDKIVKSLIDQAKAERDATLAGQQAILGKAIEREAEAQENLNKLHASGWHTQHLESVIQGRLDDARIARIQAEKNVQKIASDEKMAGIKMWLDASMQSFELEKSLAADRKRWADEDKRAAEEAIRRTDERIKLLSQALIFDDLRAKAQAGLKNLENALTTAIHAGDLTLERRIKLEEQLALVQEARARKFSGKPSEAGGPSILNTPSGDGTSPFPTGPMPLIKASQLPDLSKGPQAILEESARQLYDRINNLIKSLAATLQQGIARTLGDAIYEGFAAAFNGEGLGGIFKAFGKAILAGVGNILSQLGQTWLEYGILMTTLGQALWNPFTSGPAAIAIGAALIALGAALGAVAHRPASSASNAGSYSSSVGRGTEEITRFKFINRDGSFTDNLKQVMPIHFTVIGTNDPKAQRDIKEIVEKANRRAA